MKSNRNEDKANMLAHETTAAQKAHNRHDGGRCPDETIEDVSPQLLEDYKLSFFQAKVSVTQEEAQDIERATQSQSEDEYWRSERRKRLTASSVGGVAKMKETTKRSKKVQALLYNTFTGNAATLYGSRMETTARKEYVAYQREHGHPDLTVKKCGLFISRNNNWLAATPDGIVHDPNSNSDSMGLLEIKCPFSFLDLNFDEACKKSSFYLAPNKDKVLKLKSRHDYCYQVQCQLYCVDKSWCDFVVRTNKELHVERIYRDTK